MPILHGCFLSGTVLQWDCNMPDSSVLWQRPALYPVEHNCGNGMADSAFKKCMVKLYSQDACVGGCDHVILPCAPPGSLFLRVCRRTHPSLVPAPSLQTSACLQVFSFLEDSQADLSCHLCPLTVVCSP